ncbi:hypothetical protein NQ314_000438, partial [Rhamnusium bicolor]
MGAKQCDLKRLIAWAGRFTLQSTHLPRPEPIRVIETKTAKTLANNNRRVAGMYQQHLEDSSSKDGSLTEDSGVGSHLSVVENVVHGGEAMADEISFSLSSSDESKDKHQEDSVPISTAVIGSALQSLMSGTLSKSFASTVSSEVKNVLLTIEDPKFAAVAAASNT